MGTWGTFCGPKVKFLDDCEIYVLRMETIYKECRRKKRIGWLKHQTTVVSTITLLTVEKRLNDLISAAEKQLSISHLCPFVGTFLLQLHNTEHVLQFFEESLSQLFCRNLTTGCCSTRDQETNTFYCSNSYLRKKH